MKKVLIANRGEIAVRIIRALRELNMKSVAVHSEADRQSLHVALADESICIGPAKVKDSYLNKAELINAALLCGADAIHPGFGFLSENASFAAMCEDYGITFIGPRPEVITALGDKATARERMSATGVPVVPGSDGILQNVVEAKEAAARIGYPVLLKATAGGGGKGIREVGNPEELEEMFLQATQEAEAAFGNGDLYLEKFIIRPRHIEVQVAADHYGHAIHLGERDCSLQRNHQKVIEESPSPVVDENLRKRLGEAALRAVRAADYTNVGTVEFLVDAAGDFYFMEMNTRIQVEHPVTEMVTGIDLVQLQLQIAAGLPLSLRQEDVVLSGHAVECRINAQDPSRNFAPSCGPVTGFHAPGGNGIRVDTYLYQGYTVLPYYDAMLAKVIVRGRTRNEAIRKMRSALYEMVVEGITTNLDYQSMLTASEMFRSGEFDTGTLSGMPDGGFPAAEEEIPGTEEMNV